MRRPRYDERLVTNADARSEADDTGAAPSEPHAHRTRAMAGVVVLALVVAAALIAIYRQRHAFTAALDHVGAWGMLGSFAVACLGVALTYPVWRTVLNGLDADLGWVAGARVFFTSQLGKYVPGSVWPIVIQMEAGRLRGTPRRTMLAANLITLVLSCAVGLILACTLLPFSDSRALSHYWWLLIALPFLLALLHPRAVTFLLEQVYRRLGRQPVVTQRLPVGASARAACWALASYLATGAHVAVIALMVGGGGFATVLVCVAGIALAIPAGVLFIPAPAGAGIRDVVLGLVLHATLNSGQAILVVVASRVILIAADLALAGAALLPGRAVRS